MRGALLFAIVLIFGSTSAVLAEDFGEKLAAAAAARAGANVVYDPAYVAIAYPGGDVDAGRGVCADEIVRAYRALGIDLQVLIHEDMRAHFSDYPALWGLARPDRNIDHRRVPNLERFFTRKGARLPSSDDPAAFRPGDVVSWNLKGENGYLPHIGIVTAARAPSGAPMILHNIGAGPELEDVLFNWPITGRFRYAPTSR